MKYLGCSRFPGQLGDISFILREHRDYNLESQTSKKRVRTKELPPLQAPTCLYKNDLIGSPVQKIIRITKKN